MKTLALLALTLGLVVGPVASAQDWPDKGPVKIIAPFAPDRFRGW